MAATQSSRLEIALIKPHKEVALSSHYSKNITVHGRFQLYADLLDSETNTTLVLAACKDGDIVKLYPDKKQQGKLANRVTILSKAFACPSDPTQAEQLKITIDGNFVRRAMKQSNLDCKINFEALDMRDVPCRYYTVDEINSMKVQAAEKKNLEGQLSQLGINAPGKIVDFLQEYEREKAKRHDEWKAGQNRKELLDVTRELRGRKKLQPRKSETAAGPKSFYDLDGHKHVVRDAEKEAKMRQEERRKNRWWVRLSEPRIKVNLDRKESEEVEKTDSKTGDEQSVENNAEMD